MNTKHFRTAFVRAMYIMVIFAVALSVSTVAYAAPPSPFVGHWQAIDVDGSDIRLNIGGPPNGPFQITWTESYISFCNGEAGIVRGTGWLNESGAYLLEADLRVECFTTGASMDFQLTWRYHPVSNMLSSNYDTGVVTIWHRPGRLPEPPPALGLRVIYGYDWVHSFYEGGHMVWLTVTESDGVTVKATAELVTEPLDSLSGETGFDIRLEDWIPAPPDIQPNDWVFGWVDNGASAQVQIGDISGMIDLENDSIEGKISASWFSSEVDVDCHPWGAPLSEEILKYDAVLPDGEDTYSCSWYGEWDIQPGQDVGVGYSVPDGHWVANTFFIPMPSFAAYMPSAIEGYDWPLGNTITLNINDGEYTAQAVSEQRPDFPEGETRVLFELWKDDFSMEDGDHILMTDEVLGFTKELYVADLQVTEINLSADMVSGIYEPTYPDFWIWLDGQEPLDIQFSGHTWIATFAELLPGTWGTVAQDDWDHDGTVWDFYIPNTRFTVWPEWNYLEGYEWPDGAVVSISVDGKGVCSTEAVSGFPEGDPWNTFFSLNFPEGCGIETGDFITLSTESLSYTHQVQALSITDVDLDSDTVTGTADFDPEQYLLHTWVHGFDESYMQLSTEDRAWLADFGAQEFDLQPGMGGRVELVDQDSNATAVEWHIPAPGLIAFPAVDQIFGYGWPEGSEVSLAINGEYIATANVQGALWDPNDIMAFFDFGGLHDLIAEDEVALSGSGMELTYTVQNLSVTDVNEQANTVSGTADDGALVYAGVHEWWDVTEMPLTVENGDWVADFDLRDFDLQAGMCGRAEIRDEFSSNTAVDWCVTNPLITVFPESEYLQGYDWPDGATVTITVEDKSVCFLEMKSWGGFFDANFPEGCDLEIGDTVTFTDGTTSRTHTVRNLAITAVDMAADTVSGMADIGDVVSVGAYDFGGESEQWLTVEDGTWLANFTLTGIDLVEGMCGYARIYDEVGNWTQVDWCIPNPEIRAWLGNQRVEGYQWPVNEWISLHIFDPGTGDTFGDSQQVIATEWGSFVGFNINGWELQPGQIITMAGPVTTKVHEILPVSITSVDADLNMVAGSASSEGRIILCVYEGGCVPPTETFADASGSWFVNYGEAFDILPGFGMDATEFDEDGDGTSFDYWVP